MSHLLRMWMIPEAGSVHRRAVESMIERVSKADADPLDRLVRLLRCCGYLAERRPEGVVIGDNAHPADRDDFAALSPMGPEALRSIPWASVLSRRASGGPGVSRRDRFLQRRHGYKYPARELDGMVAYLVKALSAVGVLTRSHSCDGHGMGHLRVGIDRGCSRAWAAVLIRFFVASRLELGQVWSTEGGTLEISARSPPDGWNGTTAQWLTALDRLYAEVLEVADLLYTNRVALRDCRQRVIVALEPEVESRSDESILLNIDLLGRSGVFAWPSGGA